MEKLLFLILICIFALNIHGQITIVGDTSPTGIANNINIAKQLTQATTTALNSTTQVQHMAEMLVYQKQAISKMSISDWQSFTKAYQAGSESLTTSVNMLNEIASLNSLFLAQTSDAKGKDIAAELDNNQKTAIDILKDITALNDAQAKRLVASGNMADYAKDADQVKQMQMINQNLILAINSLEDLNTTNTKMAVFLAQQEEDRLAREELSRRETKEFINKGHRIEDITTTDELNKIMFEGKH